MTTTAQTIADDTVTTVASYTLFSRKRPDGDVFYYSVPAGFYFVLQEGLPEKFAIDKFDMFVTMAARAGSSFKMRIGPVEDSDLIGLV
jgi:hypothetical protein